MKKREKDEKMTTVVDKLAYGFIVVGAIYIALTVFGFIKMEETIGLFNIIIGGACFILGYKLTEEGFLVYNAKKIIAYGVLLGFCLGIIFFIFNIFISIVDIKTLRINFDAVLIAQTVLNKLTVIVEEILVTTPTLLAGSFLSNLQRIEKEQREGLR